MSSEYCEMRVCVIITLEEHERRTVQRTTDDGYLLISMN